MPGLLTSRKRASAGSDDDQSDASDRESQGASAHKRARLNHQHTSATNGTPNGGDGHDSSHTNGNNGNSSSTQSHQPGAIVRVTLKNFVTYTNAEFRPGPSLNMVIGPNGTGKSTLVCAICLGLGWKTEHLGRAKELAEFIKHGQNQAEIEIELAADPARHSENQVVRHTIRRSDKDKHKSTYHLNDKQCTHKMITELCRSFSIQVDNLCQFLPQDRVVEFAALSSVDLLTQTQRAAAPPHLVERHEKLKELRAVEKKCLDDQSIVMEGLKSLESRQNNQRADVERLHERQEIKEKLEALEMLRPVAAYRVARANWDRIKGQKKEAADELIALEKAAGPAQRAVQARRDYQMAVGLVLSQRVRVAENAEKRVNALLLKQDKLKEDIKSFSTRSNAEQDTLKKQKQERSRLESNVGDLKVTQSQAPPAFDAVAFNERLREATRQSRLVKDQIDENEQKYRSLGQDLRTRVTTQKSLERQIADLRSQAGQQGNKLRAASRDAFDAWSWIQANPDKIPGPVFGPPIVSCSVKDPKHAIIIENALSAAEMQAFTVTTQEAYQVLQRVLYKDMKLADINIRVCKKQGLVAQARPVPQQELGQLGLDTYVIDLIDGPSEVLEMMCQSRMIHQTGVAFRNVSDASAESISKSRISSYVTPTETFTIVRRREYGDQGTSIRTQRLRPAQFFGSQTVDVQAEQDLKRELQEVIDQAEAIQTQGKGYKQTIVELQDKVKAIESDRRKTQEEKDEQQQALTQFNGLGIKLQALERKLESLEHVESESRTRSRKIHIEHSDALMQRAKDALLIENAVTILHRLHVDLSNCQILSVEAQSEYERVDGAHKDVRNNLKLRADHLETLKTELERSKTAAKALLEESNRLMQQRSQKQADFHAEQPEKQLPEDLDNDIVSLTVRLEMFHEGDPNVLRDYEQRAAKIERAQQKIKATERELGELGTQIATLRQQWEPELDRLVSQMSEAFAENFSRIGCAGEVRVHKEDDFANWAIQVMVKFRENEPLSVLDAHRQSGGERAVSTIFYLMALQSLARAPFRVVDEINQGMDPRNERLVHSRIVDIACAEHTSQYFLITPKLLPNLQYHPKMKVHCIASGEYMPSDYRKLDFQALAKKALRVKQRNIIAQAC